MKLKTQDQLDRKPGRTKNRKKKTYIPLKPESFMLGVDPKGERVQRAVPALKDALQDADPAVRLFARQVLEDVRNAK
jgi:hypothetical protein